MPKELPKEINDFLVQLHYLKESTLLEFIKIFLKEVTESGGYNLQDVIGLLNNINEEIEIE